MTQPVQSSIKSFLIPVLTVTQHRQQKMRQSLEQDTLAPVTIKEEKTHDIFVQTFAVYTFKLTKLYSQPGISPVSKHSE